MNCKKLIARIFSSLLLLSALAPAAQARKPEFKMHIRLWQHHHEVDTLSNQLLEALKKYPGFCDEVWFYSSYSPSKEVDYLSVSKLKRMGEEMRKLGIVPSFQLISMGHPEAADAPADPGLNWETLTGPDGTAAKQQSCPRRKAFQEDLIRYYEIWGKTETREGITLNIEMGNEYYVRTYVKFGAALWRPKLELKTPLEAEPEWNSIR